MLAAAAFDCVREVRQTIELIKTAGVCPIVRLENSPSLVFRKGGGVKREDASRLRSRTGSASVVVGWFPAS